MTAKEYFDENLSGEPLTEEAVIEALEDFKNIKINEIIFE